jgi:hypothetical protein
MNFVKSSLSAGPMIINQRPPKSFSAGKWGGDWLMLPSAFIAGHMEVEVHLDDPKAFTKPITIHFNE